MNSAEIAGLWCVEWDQAHGGTAVRRLDEVVQRNGALRAEGKRVEWSLLAVMARMQDALEVAARVRAENRGKRTDGTDETD
jgi:hypothetical protein